ncbi:hypothetical protein CEY12_05980 [Chryseobacterium sp. T16E-39]|nr:hypothetical protein CEY12_05980 [Chryseobacterium sp. T16E-39]
MLSHLKEVNKIKYSTLSALGTFLVLYSSLIPFSNTIIEAFYPEVKNISVEAASNNLSAVIWSVFICLQPAFLILVRHLKPYEISYAFPLFTSLYSASFYFLPLLGHTPNENFWFFFWLIIITLFLLSTMQAINVVFKIQKVKEKAYMNAMQKKYSNDIK